jgi:Glycosyltransferase family 87
MRTAFVRVLFGVVPVAVTVALVVFEIHTNALALDMRVAYWPAASRLLHGASPYAVTRHDIAIGWAFVYPALSAVVFAPFAWASNALAQVLWALALLACVPAVLYALDVRDFRVYGVTLLWLPVFVGWQGGNLTLPLTLAVALTWRWRARPMPAGLLTAAAISLKPFVWPLGLWLLATRRWRAAAWALVWGVVINLISWAIVGFNEIGVYLHLSSEVTHALWMSGYSMMAVAHHLGLRRTAAEELLIVVSAVVAACVLYVGLLKRRERDALVLAVLLMLLASPLLWSHYFALLLVPLALSRSRLSPVWVVGLLMWPMPPRKPVHGWEEVLAWSLTAICIAVALSRRPGGMEGRDELWAHGPQPA